MILQTKHHVWDSSVSQILIIHITTEQYQC
uniref:Uncharacterized protein n=1 Tax=Anguilla anguilla TaxID=7936 RepID=A0A0E9TVP8_ANGAN